MERTDYGLSKYEMFEKAVMFIINLITMKSAYIMHIPLIIFVFQLFDKS